MDHSKIDYLPIRKNFYIESPLITKMTEVNGIPQISILGRGNKSSQRMANGDSRESHYTRPILTWSQCGLTEKIMHVINKLGYEKPFPIQCQVRT